MQIAAFGIGGLAPVGAAGSAVWVGAEDAVDFGFDAAEAFARIGGGAGDLSDEAAAGIVDQPVSRRVEPGMPPRTRCFLQRPPEQDLIVVVDLFPCRRGAQPSVVDVQESRFQAATTARPTGCPKSIRRTPGLTSHHGEFPVPGAAMTAVSGLSLRNARRSNTGKTPGWSRQSTRNESRAGDRTREWFGSSVRASASTARGLLFAER